MSSAKSDESSCHSDAEPDSVATWRRVVEDDAVRLARSVGLFGSPTKVVGATFFCGVGRRTRRGRGPRRGPACAAGRARSRSAESFEPPLSTRAGPRGARPSAARRPASSSSTARAACPGGRRPSTRTSPVERDVLRRAVLGRSRGFPCRAVGVARPGTSTRTSPPAVAAEASAVLEADLDPLGA